MSNYTKLTNFAVKDTLANGDPNKVIRGTDLDAEFQAIASASSTKTDDATLATVAKTGKYSDLSGIPAGYSLPVATPTVLGGVKQGNNVSIAGDGTLSVTFPTYSTVASTGSYTDLTNKPTLGTIASQNATSVAITGGSIDGTSFGATTPAAVNASKVSTAVSALGSISGTVSIDCSVANVYTFTPSTATTLSFTNPPAAGRAQVIVLKITNGGAQTITYPSGSKFPGGTAPTLTSAGIDWLGVAYDVSIPAWVIFTLGKDVK